MIRILSFILIAFIAQTTVAQEKNYDAFSRYLENGKLTLAEKEIDRLAPNKSVHRSFLLSRLSFFKQDYDKALQILKSLQVPKSLRGHVDSFKELVEITHQHTKGFQSIKTPHFDLRFQPGKDQILAMYAGDALETAWERIGSNLGAKPKERMVIEFYPSWKQFTDVSTLTEKEVKTSGTIALCKFNRMMVTTPRALLRGYRWIDTVVHEYVHYVVNRATDTQTPVWMHEGIAKYEEIRWRKERGSEIARRSQALLKHRLEKETLITFEQMHPSMAKLPSAEDAELAFAEVFYFIKYIVEENGGFSKLRGILNLIQKGKGANQAVATAFGMPFNRVYKNWMAWLKKQPLATDRIGRKEEIAFKDADKRVDEAHIEAREIQNEKAKGWMRLGDLLVEKNRNRAALIEYEKARKNLRNPEPLLLAKISHAALTLGNKAQAESALTEAITAAPDRASNLVLRGLLYLDQKKYKKAEADLLNANAINPFDPRIHIGLKEIYGKRSKPLKMKRETTILNLIDT